MPHTDQAEALTTEIVLITMFYSTNKDMEMEY